MAPPLTADMPKFTLDFVQRLFIAKAGVTAVDVEVDLYSDWKEAILATPEADAYPPAFRSIGGDPISATQNAGATFFLLNGYKIRPQETNHRLDIDGNIFSDPAGQDLVVPTLGGFAVQVVFTVSNLVDSSIARLDLKELQGAVHVDTVSGDDANSGSPTQPVQTITQARALADADNLRTIFFRGDITLDQSYQSFSFVSENGEASSVNLGGQNVDRSDFFRCTVTGDQGGGHCEIREGVVDALTNFDGVMRWVGFKNSIHLAPNSEVVLHECFSELAGATRAVIDCNVAATIIELNVRSWSGGLRLDNVNNSTEVVNVDFNPGTLEITASCTDGRIQARGVALLIDNGGAGLTRDFSALLEPDQLRLLRKLTQNRLETDPNTGVITVYDDDDTTVLLQANIFEDVAGTQPYRGRGAERRGRLS